MCTWLRSIPPCQANTGIPICSASAIATPNASPCPLAVKNTSDAAMMLAFSTGSMTMGMNKARGCSVNWAVFRPRKYQSGFWFKSRTTVSCAHSISKVSSPPKRRITNASSGIPSSALTPPSGLDTSTIKSRAWKSSAFSHPFFSAASPKANSPSFLPADPVTCSRIESANQSEMNANLEPWGSYCWKTACTSVLTPGTTSPSLAPALIKYAASKDSAALGTSNWDEWGSNLNSFSMRAMIRGTFAGDWLQYEISVSWPPARKTRA